MPTSKLSDAFSLAGLDADLGADAVERILSIARERSLAADEVLVREGDDIAALFVVVEGKLAAGPAARAIGAGGTVADLALLAGGRQAETVRAVEPSRVLVLDRQAFAALAAEHPAIAEAFSKLLRTRVRRAKVAVALRELLGDIDTSHLRAIENQVRWVHLAGGQELFHQGDPSHGAYIVMLGRLAVAVAAPGGERVIDEVGAGEWLGEMGLLTESDRSATVYALRDSELVWLPQQIFTDYVCKDVALLLPTARSIAKRMQRQMQRGTASERPRLHGKTITIVPCDSDRDVGWFARELARQLGAFGSACIVTSNEVDTGIGRPNIAQSNPEDTANIVVSDWLLDRERLFDFTLYLADVGSTEWTSRTLRHADHVLFVAASTSPPRLCEAERSFFAARRPDRRPPQSLVLLQPDQECPFVGTADWLRERNTSAHYHVRRRRATDVARLARHLTGNAVCLVFGGGGSRGYAHIGVCQVFEQLGIPIDAVGGTSIGSVIAGMLAMGMTASDILRVAPPFLQASFFNPTLPVVSLMSGENMLKRGRVVLGEHMIEDLLIPMFCISTSLTRGGEHVHRTGDCGAALRASGSVPGILPPLPFGDSELLIDGGLSNNLPIDVATSLWRGKVIAVDVVPESELVTNRELPAFVSGWKYVWGHISPFSKPIAMPNILSIMFRTVTTSTQGLRNANELGAGCALYLRPPVSRWNLMDFRAAEAIAAEGERATRAAIETWWQTAKPGVMPGARDSS